ncbi:flippase [Puia sp.]|uniref:flippase n=1 Tax=Puia sp. TaxID=2045100 RepID=UPI002F418FAD
MKKYLSSYWIRSAFFSILQRFSVTLFGLINFIVLIRFSLSKEQMGTWSLFLAITTIFETTKSGLLKNAHIRYVSTSDVSDEKTTIASSSLLINASISILFIGLIIFFSGSVSTLLHTGADLGTTLLWFIPGLVCMVFFSHMEAIQQSHLDFKGVFAGYFVRQIVFFTLILGTALLRIPFALPWLALYQSFSIALGTIVITLYSRKYLIGRFNPSKLWIKKIFNYGGYIFGSGLLGNIFASVDQFMVATFKLSNAWVANYSAAAKLNQVVDIPSYAAAEVLFPKVSKASIDEGKEKVRYLYEKMVGILMAFTIPTAIFVIIFPKFVILLIAGKNYMEAAPILQMYMITGLLRPMQNQGANLLNSIGKARLCFIINAISLGGNLVINYICLSNLGFYGSAVGTMITCLLGAICWYFIIKRQIGAVLPTMARHVAEYYKLFFTYAKGFLSPQPSGK